MNYKIISNFSPREHDRLASFFSKCGLWTSNMASPGILLEMQNIMPTPDQPYQSMSWSSCALADGRESEALPVTALPVPS